MPKENNKMQVDIDTLKKQNVNDLLSIKELYSKLKEVEEKITQIKYIDNTLTKKLKKEYEKLKKTILDENVQVKLTNDIKTINLHLTTNTQQINENKQLINVLSLGVKNDGSIDCTDIIHQAKKSYALFFPKGTYLLEYLKLCAGDVIIGESECNTTLKPNISSKDSFVFLEKGAVNNVRWENFKIAKSPNDNQIGIHIRAEFDDSKTHGGLWDSSIKNIYLTTGIKGYAWNGVGLKIVGSGNNILLPIQLNTFEKVNIWTDNENKPNNIPLIIEGQVEQNSFIRCTFSGVVYDKSITDLNNVAGLFRRKRNSNGSIDGDQGGGPNTFLQCYFGNVGRCLKFERSYNPTFINCYYENARQFLNINTIGKATIIGGTFMNVNGEEFNIVSDDTKNELVISNVATSMKAKCKGLNYTGNGITNKVYGEIGVDNTEIIFSDLYNLIHCNHKTNEITINKFSPDTILKSYTEFYFNFISKPNKQINFSKADGNIINDLNINISSDSIRVKATFIPYLNKYKVEVL